MYLVYCVRTTLEPFPNFVKGSAGRRYDIVMLKALLGEEDQDADTNSCLRRAAFAMPANYGAVPAGSEVEPILHHIVPKCDVSGPTGIAACGDDFTAFVDEHGEV